MFAEDLAQQAREAVIRRLRNKKEEKDLVVL